MSVLFIDTNGEMPAVIAEEYNFNNVIRMPYTICGEEYYPELGGKFDAKTFYALVRGGNMPITSALNSEDYIEYFEPFFKAGEDILYVSFSQNLSGTFKYMDTAIKELSAKYPKAKFTRFDTKGISLAAGIPGSIAVKMHSEGKSNEEIIAVLTDLIKKIDTSVSPDNLFHLSKGGRLSGAAALMGTVLQLKPILKIDGDGKLVAAMKVSGRKKALMTIVDHVIKNADTAYPIAVLDADCDEDGTKIYEKIKESLPDATIWRCTVGPTVGTHCGPDTVGTVFVSKTEVR